MEEKFIKALSSLIGIKESKLKEVKEKADIYSILDRPNVINPTELQLQKINLLSELKANLNISRDFRHKSQISFSNSTEAGRYFKHIIGNRKDKEFFLLAMFDRDNNLIKINKISEGTIDMTLTPPREILKRIITNPKCKSVLFCHNHPSGVTEPSDVDISLTKDLINILEPLKIHVKDHIIVGDDVFSFRDNGLINNINYKAKVVETFAEISSANNYYEQHLKKYINALIGLVGINKEKLISYIEDEKEKVPNSKYHALIYLKLIEEPEITASKLGLSSTERKRLEDIKILMDNINSHIKNDMVRVRAPDDIDIYVRAQLKESELKENNLYIMLFNTKNKILGFEKLSFYEGNKIVYNPKDILLKSLNYEAKSVSIIMTARDENVNIRNENVDKLINILRNTANIVMPIRINLLDGLYINEHKYYSMKEKGLLPYTVVGQPEYKKEIVFDYNITEEVKKESNIYVDYLELDEDEEEWEL